MENTLPIIIYLSILHLCSFCRNVGSVGSVEHRRHHGGTLITLCVTYVIKTRTKATNVHCVTTSKETKEWCSVTLVAGGFKQPLYFQIFLIT